MAKKPTLLLNIQKEDMKTDILHAHTKTFTLIRKHTNTLNTNKVLELYFTVTIFVV